MTGVRGNLVRGSGLSGINVTGSEVDSPALTLFSNQVFASGDSGVSIVNANDVVVDEILIQDSDGAGLFVIGSERIDFINNSATDDVNRIVGSVTDGIAISNSDVVTVRDAEILESGGTGAFFLDVDGLMIETLNIGSSDQDGLSVSNSMDVVVTEVVVDSSGNPAMLPDQPAMPGVGAFFLNVTDGNDVDTNGLTVSGLTTGNSVADGFSVSGSSGVSIEDLLVSSSGRTGVFLQSNTSLRMVGATVTNSDSDGLAAANSSGLDFEQVDVFNSGLIGALFRNIREDNNPDLDQDGLRFVDGSIANSGAEGLFVSDSDSAFVENISIVDSGRVGASFLDTEEVTFSSSRIDGSAGDGLEVDGEFSRESTTSTLADHAPNVNLLGNTITASGGMGIELVSVINARVETNRVTGSVDDGIASRDSRNVDVVNNVILNNGTTTGSSGLAFRSTDQGSIAGNVIGNSGGIGIEISGLGASGNVLTNNTIGLDDQGRMATNTTGILIDNTSSNVIGGQSLAEANVIVGSDLGRNNLLDGDLTDLTTGIQILGLNAFNNVVRFNFIGTTPNGRKDVGNSVGVFVNEGRFNRIENNVIAENAEAGVLLVGAFSFDPVTGEPTSQTEVNNVVEGNRIAANELGVLILDGGNNRVIDHREAIVIGDGITAGIVGNTLLGVQVNGRSSTNNVIQGNAIESNGQGGIFINNAPNTIIGGTGDQSNRIVNNWVGVDSSVGIQVLGTFAREAFASFDGPGESFLGTSLPDNDGEPGTSLDERTTFLDRGALIQGNLIAGSGNGVFLNATSNNTVGSRSELPLEFRQAAANQIENNTSVGVYIFGGGSEADGGALPMLSVNNRVDGNFLTNNGGDNGYGILLFNASRMENIVVIDASPANRVVGSTFPLREFNGQIIDRVDPDTGEPRETNEDGFAGHITAQERLARQRAERQAAMQERMAQQRAALQARLEAQRERFARGPSRAPFAFAGQGQSASSPRPFANRPNGLPGSIATGSGPFQANRAAMILAFQQQAGSVPGQPVSPLES